MPEQTHKLVHVPDVGVVAFPADLEDDHVKKLIKSFREQKKQKASDVKLDDSFKPLPTEHINLPKTPSRFGGVTTEQTEHARQLKAAQPLSTAIPSLPDWANIPLSTQFEKFEEKHPNVYGLDLERRKQEKQSAAEFAHDFPVAGGVVQAVNQFAEGMTSPANMALMLGAPESKILSGIFAAQAMKGSYGDAQKARKAYEDGNNAEAAQYVTQAVLGLGVAGLAGTHAYKGLPEGVRAKIESEEGSVPITPGTPNNKLESEPGYAYHATNIERLHDIADSGKLRIYGPSYGTDQSAWPDRATEKRAYFTPNAGSAWQFAPEEGTPAIIRTKSEGLKSEGGTGDMYSKAPIGSHALEYYGSDKQWHPVQRLATPAEGNRTYYRGQNPESAEKIKTGDNFWDSLLFVADDPKHAQNYGRNIDKVQLKPDAHILREGTPEFKRVVGPYRPGENMLQFSSRAAQIAKKAGYDAVHFQLQGTVGTAILNPDAIESRSPHNYSPSLTDPLAQIKTQAEAVKNGEVAPTERRTNTELRKRLSEMSPEEMHKLLTTSEVVNLPNKRSFEEDQHFAPMPFVARSDADGLKAFNDKFGYEKGDELLRAKAEALKEAGLNAYHEKGDEFLYRGMSDKELQGRLEKAREILRNKTFDVTLDDGTHVQLKGVDFSYGTGKDLKEAETRQHAHKAEREAAGQRKRGELVGLTEVGPQADSQGQGPAQGGAAAPLAEVKKQAAELKPTTAYQAIDQSQPFYLKSENLINEKMKGPMAADDVHRMLLSNGVKPEEMQWTGLDEFLKAKGKSKVTPQEIQEHLAGNNLQIKEVMKGNLDHGAPLTPTQVEEAIKGNQRGAIYGVDRDSGLLATERSTGLTTKALAKYLQDNAHNFRVYKGPVAEMQPTKFGSYTLPGAEPGSYRELLLTMPPKTAPQHFIAYKGGPTIGQGYANLSEAQSEMADLFPNRDDIEIRQGVGDRSTTNRTPENFRSSHWDEPNVLGHIRMNDRTGPNGEKILHIEELQSDLHQSARTQGYRLPSEITSKMDSEYRALVHKNADARTRGEEPNPEDVARAKELEAELIKADKSKIPDAPFKKTWPELMLKRMVRWALDHGDSPALQNLRQPESVRELSKNVFGSKMALAMPLEQMDGGVLSVLKHDQVKRAVISLLPVDVVNDLKAAQLSPDDIFRNPDMLVARLPSNHLSNVAQGVITAARTTAASLRAKLSSSVVRGSDEELLPALYAHDLTAREIVGMLSPELIYHDGAFLSTMSNSGTSLGTKFAPSSDDLAGVNIKGIPASGTQFLNSSLPTLRRTMPYDVGTTRSYAKGDTTRIADLLNWHNHILLKAGISNQAVYAPGYDGISWTPGEEQANRYDLSTQVDNIVVMPKADGSRAVRIHPKNGDSIKLMVDEDGKVENAFQSGAEFGGKNLADIVGKEVAEKILHAPYIDVAKMKAEDKTTVQRNGKDVEVTVDPERRIDHTNSSHIMVKDKEDNRWYVNLSDLGTYHLRGLDLKVGGEGMKGFYDKIIPDAANKLGKQWGAKVRETTFGAQQSTIDALKAEADTKYEDWRKLKNEFERHQGHANEPEVDKAYDAWGEALDKYKEAKTRPSYIVPYLPVTPQMRTGIKGVPYSLFGVAGAAAGLQAIKQKADDLRKQFRSVGVGR